MAIIFPRDFPTVNGQSIIEKMTIRQVSAVAVQQSPYTYQQQIQDFGGQRWEAEVTIRPLAHNEALAFQAFLSSLKGQKNTFKLGNPLSVSPYANNAITINGDHDKGDATVTFHVATNTSASAGQFFSINDRLHMFLEDLTTTPSTIDISPPLKEDLSNGDNCVLDEPVGIWRLSTNDVGWDISKSGVYNFTFACVEAL